MDELTKIKSIKKDKQSRAYVTGLHSTPAGMQATELLLKYTDKTNNPVLFALIAFPDLEHLLSLGGFTALKDTWPTMAKRLNKYLPPSSLCSQTQFGLLIQIWDGKAVKKLIRSELEQLIKDLNRPFNLSDSSKIRSFSLRSYAGYLILPGDGESTSNADSNAESLLSKLAIAAASASHSEERLKHFTPSLQKILVRQEYAINNLPLAIKNEHLNLRFQPQFSSRKHCICSAQTSIIWQDPHHGTINGAEFKHAVDLTGTQIDIIKLAIRNSASFLKKLEDKNYLPAEFKLFVSMPFEVFYNRNFDIYAELQKSLSTSEINPDRIAIDIEGNLELTPTDYIHALSCLRKVKGLGISICLSSDSNLTTLKLLNAGVIHQLKWNLCSAGDLKPEDQICILGSIMAVARHNRVGLIVGGIDFKHQLKQLNQSRIDALQGSLFSEQLSESAFHHYLKFSSAQTRALSDKKMTLVNKQ